MGFYSKRNGMAGGAEIFLLSIKKPSSDTEEGVKIIVGSKSLFLVLQRLSEKFL